MLRVDQLQAGNLPPLSFEIASGECLAVEGPSGSGKSRLLRAIADLDPASGRIFLEGAERREMSGPAWRRLVRYVAAESVWWTDTARAAFSRLPQHAPRIDRLASSLGLAPELLDRPLSRLSTGERLRLSLARALVDEPKVIMFDEPTASLDPASAALTEELLRYQTLAGRMVILVSHDAGLRERQAHARLMLPQPKSASQQPLRGQKAPVVRAAS